MRAAAAASARPAHYEPRTDADGTQTYERFLAATGLAVDERASEVVA
jgi:hypothetical protein